MKEVASWPCQSSGGQWWVARGKGVDWNCITYPVLKGIHDAPNSRWVIVFFGYNQESRRAPPDTDQYEAQTS